MKYLVTGGTGFIGSALVRRLLVDGAVVRVLDDGSRGRGRRLQSVATDIEMLQADVRDADAVGRACRGIDRIVHLAAVNGTEFFYSIPHVVLDVGVKGMLNVLDAAVAAGVQEVYLASSSEVYHHPAIIPTPETVPLVIPDPLNPRYSYAASKIVSELLTINVGRQNLRRAVIFRPHNVYGPDMGWEHAMPHLTLRIRDLARAHPAGALRLPVQGNGSQTRAFVYVDDAVDGIMRVIERGDNFGIYNVGNDEEVTIAAVAREIGACFGREIEIVPGEAAAGGTPRRSPDISKLRLLGYLARVPLREGILRTVRWYDANADARPTDRRASTVDQPVT